MQSAAAARQQQPASVAHPPAWPIGHTGRALLSVLECVWCARVSCGRSLLCLATVCLCIFSRRST